MRDFERRTNPRSIVSPRRDGRRDGAAAHADRGAAPHDRDGPRRRSTGAVSPAGAVSALLLDQVLERGQGRPRAFAGGDHDLLVAVVGHVAGGEDAAHPGGAVLVDGDLADHVGLEQVERELAVGKQADLDEHAVHGRGGGSRPSARRARSWPRPCRRRGSRRARGSAATRRGAPPRPCPAGWRRRSSLRSTPGRPWRHAVHLDGRFEPRVAGADHRDREPLKSGPSQVEQ